MWLIDRAAGCHWAGCWTRWVRSLWGGDVSQSPWAPYVPDSRYRFASVVTFVDMFVLFSSLSTIFSPRLVSIDFRDFFTFNRCRESHDRHKMLYQPHSFLPPPARIPPISILVVFQLVFPFPLFFCFGADESMHGGEQSAFTSSRCPTTRAALQAKPSATNSSLRAADHVHGLTSTSAVLRSPLTHHNTPSFRPSLHAYWAYTHRESLTHTQASTFRYTRIPTPSHSLTRTHPLDPIGPPVHARNSLSLH